MASKIVWAVLAGASILLAWTSPEERGRDVFVKRCSGCHALNVNREGPRLNGVYGRKAGSVPDFTYSEGLKKTGMRWDSATLNAWLADPEATVPDTDMAFRLPIAEERNAVIAYLRSLGKE